MSERYTSEDISEEVEMEQEAHEIARGEASLGDSEQGNIERGETTANRVVNQSDRVKLKNELPGFLRELNLKGNYTAFDDSGMLREIAKNELEAISESATVMSAEDLELAIRKSEIELSKFTPILKERSFGEQPLTLDLLRLSAMYQERDKRARAVRRDI